jgi:aromatic ring hydroxylase
VDDILSILKNPREALEKHGMIYQLKNDEIKLLKLYLRSMISKFVMPSTMMECWAMGSQEYVKEAICNDEKYLKQHNLELKKKALGPLPSN